MSLASALNWNFHGFNPDQETWDAFEQRFTAFARFNNVDESRQALQLLTALNPEQFGKLSASCVPKNPIDLPFEDLIDHLRRLFKVKKCLAAEQVNFFLTRQDGQSYMEFLNELKEKARTCDFELYRTTSNSSWLNQALFIAFVMGIDSVDVRRKLLTTDGLDVDKALAIAQTCEVVNEHEEKKGKLGRKRKPSNSSATDSDDDASPEACQVCGRDNHRREACWFRGAICDKCHTRGHLAAVCQSRVKKGRGKKGTY